MQVEVDPEPERSRRERRSRPPARLAQRSIAAWQGSHHGTKRHLVSGAHRPQAPHANEPLRLEQPTMGPARNPFDTGCEAAGI